MTDAYPTKDTHRPLEVKPLDSIEQDNPNVSNLAHRNLAARKQDGKLFRERRDDDSEIDIQLRADSAHAASLNSIVVAALRPRLTHNFIEVDSRSLPLVEGFLVERHFNNYG